ncbi:MAG: 2-oxo acid dehydrogenase subunit E2 [Clostridiales bacterium]|nr:2-oxo acid dehydrogenase subunit E2 [Clostridiales bacterium]MCD7828762.1 2-oxo acid dehydrogenase subunit E2 [Clostridiales bacterium]
MNRRPRSVSRFGIQRKIVANMTSESWRSIPHVSYVFEPDMTDFIVKYREFDSNLKKEGKHVTLNTVILKAIAEALKKAPQLNAHFHFEPKLVRGKVTTYDQIDISMPWILPDEKMMTITMKDIGNRSLGNITEYMAKTAKKIEKTDVNEAMYQVSMHDTFDKLSKGKFLQVGQRLFGSFTNKNHRVHHLTGDAKKAYDAIPDDDKITYEDLQQGTITVSNIGASTRGHDGTLAMLMIIPPQVCAIGICSLTKKPIVVTNEKGEDEIKIRTTIPLDICFDHRVLDFGEVKPFMDALQDIFNHPESFLKY